VGRSAFPKDAASKDYQVYLWRVTHTDDQKFIPSVQTAKCPLLPPLILNRDLLLADGLSLHHHQASMDRVAWLRNEWKSFGAAFVARLVRRLLFGCLSGAPIALALHFLSIDDVFLPTIREEWTRKSAVLILLRKTLEGLRRLAEDHPFRPRRLDVSVIPTPCLQGFRAL